MAFESRRREEVTVRVAEAWVGRPVSSRLRTGRCFHIDTFEDYTSVATEKWRQSSGTIALATDFPKLGKQCLKLTTGTLVDETAGAVLQMGGFPLGRFGIEFDLQCGEGAINIREIGSYFTLFDGLNSYSGGIKWLGEANKKFQYKKTPSWYDIGAYDLYIESAYQPCWHHIKWAIDLLKMKYVALYVNEKVWDLSAFDATKGSSAQSPRLEFYFTVINAVATAGRNVRFDNLILTDEEP